MMKPQEIVAAAVVALAVLIVVFAGIEQRFGPSHRARALAVAHQDESSPDNYSMVAPPTVHDQKTNDPTVTPPRKRE